MSQENDLPLGWASASLAEVLSNPRPKVQPSPDTDLPFVGMDSIAPGSTSVGEVYRFSEMKSAAGHFLPGDVLYGRMRPYLNKVYRADFEGACSAEFIVIPESAYLDSDFLKYLLHNRDFVSFASSKSSGDRPRVDVGDISGYTFGLPPLNEQQRIAEKIDELFSQVSAGEQVLGRAQKLLERYRQSVLNAAVAGQLTRDWREQHKGEIESGETLLKRVLLARHEAWEEAELAKLHVRGMRPKDDRWKQKYKEPTLPGTTDLFPLPEGWVWVSWQQVGFCQNGRPFPSKDYKNAGVKLLRPGNLHISGRIEWTGTNTAYLDDHWREKNSDLSLSPGDIVINLTAQSLADEFLGRVCMLGAGDDSLLNQRLARLTPVLINRRYCLFLFKSRLFRSFIETGINTGSLIQHMFTRQIDNFVFPLPSLAEQNVISEQCDLLWSAAAAIERTLEETNARSQSLRQSVLSAAFAGKLVPQDLADEPASVLLERIREERLATAQNPGRRRTARRGRSSKGSEPTMIKTRKEINPTHLRDIVRTSNGGMAAQALWKASELDIDDFYKQLRDEVAAGHLREERDSGMSRIVCR